MTSWKGRIQAVPEAIFRFMRTQTVKPDEFYLWLSTDEFPSKELELPRELLLICYGMNIKLKWCKYNEYAFKRWHVFPEHMNDLVISIDDDMDYFNTLIEDCIQEYKTNPTPHVIHYSACGGLIEIREGISYCVTQQYNGPDTKNYFFGQCAFTPGSFPLECISDKNSSLKRAICPKTDEGWIHPFLIKNNIPIVFLSSEKPRREHEEMQIAALRNDLHLNLVNINGTNYKRADVFRYMVIKSSPELTSAWLKAFPNYNVNEFSESADILVSYLV